MGALALGLSVAPFVADAAVQSRLITAACRIRDYIYTFSIIIGVIYVIVAAWKYMSAGGDATKVSEAHKALTWAAVGIGVAIIAVGVPNIVSGLLGGGTVASGCSAVTP
jgi:uncharacterized membrane protein YidH (DUF202 family)